MDIPSFINDLLGPSRGFKGEKIGKADFLPLKTFGLAGLACSQTRQTVVIQLN